MSRKTDDKTLVAALRILVNDIQSDDGVANACIAEAADKIESIAQWIRVEDRPPKVDKDVFIRGVEAGEIACASFSDSGWMPSCVHSDYTVYLEFEPIEWMEPPK